MLSGGKFKTNKNKNQLIIKLKTIMDKETQVPTLSKKAVTSSADYKGYRFDEDNTGYAPKNLRFSFFTDDGETFIGSGESIEDCKQQIDELCETK